MPSLYFHDVWKGDIMTANNRVCLWSLMKIKFCRVLQKNISKYFFLTIFTDLCFSPLNNTMNQTNLTHTISAATEFWEYEDKQKLSFFFKIQLVLKIFTQPFLFIPLTPTPPTPIPTPPPGGECCPSREESRKLAVSGGRCCCVSLLCG